MARDPELETRLNSLIRRVDDLEEGVKGELRTAGQMIGETINEVRNKDAGYLFLLYLPGVSLAMILAWTEKQSILWTALKGLLSWGYVIWKAIA